MPQLGSENEAGRIVAWLKAVGDRVDRGEPIAEIETEKSTVEMEALVSGVLVEILQVGGSEVPVGATIGEIETEG